MYTEKATRQEAYSIGYGNIHMVMVGGGVVNHTGRGGNQALPSETDPIPNELILK